MIVMENLHHQIINRVFDRSPIGRERLSKNHYRVSFMEKYLQVIPSLFSSRKLIIQPRVYTLFEIKNFGRLAHSGLTG